MTLEARLADLQARGCYPSLCRRGRVWRAHINACGNVWSEGKTPHAALEKAVRAWTAMGRPMDGVAAKGARP